MCRAAGGTSVGGGRPPSSFCLRRLQATCCVLCVVFMFAKYGILLDIRFSTAEQRRSQPDHHDKPKPQACSHSSGDN